MKKNEVIITSCSRTAVGTLGKSLKNVKSDDLGASVISDQLLRSNLNPRTLMKL